MEQLALLDYTKYLCDPNQVFLTKLNILWLFYQTLTYIPILIFTYLRFRKQLPNEAYYDTKKEFPTNWIDYVMKIHSYICIIFYVPELIINVYQLQSLCKMFFVYHHIVTLYAISHFLTMNHFPWFIIFPIGFHTVLLVFSEYKFLNYFYLATIILCYIGCSQKPFKGRPAYDAMVTSIKFMTGAFVGLWFFNCSNGISIS